MVLCCGGLTIKVGANAQGTVLVDQEEGGD